MKVHTQTLLLVTALTTIVTVSCHNPYNCTEDCQNGGKCVPIPNELTAFKCYCGNEYYGVYCELHAGCKAVECFNGGTCQNKNNSYGFECICAKGYDGRLCQEADICILKNPNCLNQGVCSLKRIGGEMTTRCRCKKGFSGERCEYGDGCSNVTCGNNGICERIENRTKCSCKEGFKGEGCLVEDFCVTKFSKNCLNGGNCSESNSSAYTCSCVPDFNGHDCELENGKNITELPKESTTEIPKNENTSLTTNIAELENNNTNLAPNISGNNPFACFGNKCENQGTCFPLPMTPSSYKCYCGSEFYGDFCQFYTSCKDIQCLNGGTCQNKEAKDFLCICPPGYDGKFCEESDFCILKNPNCENGGICSLKRTEEKIKTWCRCPKPFYGERCESNKLCMNKTCRNGGICEVNGTNITCQCKDGFTGSQCKIEDYCVTTFSAKCLNGAACSANDSSNYTCDCQVNFAGHDCEFENVCLVDQCNGGVCVTSGNGSFTCECIQGFNGSKCEIEDYCVTSFSENCLNGGKCSASNSSNYNCICPADFTGHDCEFKNACFVNPCKNDGICVSIGSNFTCHCEEGFNGTTCGIEHESLPMEQHNKTSPCDRNFCKNNATCFPISTATAKYTCNCTSEFQGQFCEDPTECQDFNCRNGGTCVNSNNGASCVCPYGYEGKFCQDADFCILKNPHCENNGVCTLKRVGNEMTTKCRCPKAFTGEKCESKNTCLNNTCGIHGKCENIRNATKCNCNAGYEGKSCEVQNYCITTYSRNCLNDGICVKSQSNSTKYTCACATGFTGHDCEIEEPTTPYSPAIPFQCFELICQNGGICVPDPTQPFTSKCYCGHEYYGNVCQFPTGCKYVQCMNGGTCENKNNSHGKDFHCICPEGFNGTLCEEQDICILKNPNCSSNAVCSLRRNGTQIQTWCKCSKGFHGEKCEFQNACTNETCKNGGVCKDVQNTTECHCKPGFNGTYCEIQDHCVTTFSTKCLNGGTCSSSNATDYICSCTANFTGHDCEIEHPCFKITCKHNTTKLLVSKTKCMCQCGSKFGMYWGEECEYENACRSSPCLNNGTCKRERNEYICKCLHGFSGHDCELRNPCYFENDCENGLCKRLDNFQHNCSCQLGFYGPRCEFNDSCFKNPCLNDGICKRMNNSRKCICPKSFAGVDCQLRNPCLKNATICLNGGKCRPNKYGNSTICMCPRKFTGLNCEKVRKREQPMSRSRGLASCKPNSCHYHGKCTPPRSRFSTVTCKCQRGFKGKFCGTEDLCLTKYLGGCKNGGKCFNATIKKSKNGTLFSCQCKSGFTGPHCEHKDPCNSGGKVFCLNNGNCKRIDNVKAKCTCKPPFKGVHCEEKDLCMIGIGKCITGTFPDLSNYCNPCESGASKCKKIGPDNYSCTCRIGFAGKGCEFDVNGTFPTTARMGEKTKVEMEVTNYLDTDEFEWDFGEGPSLKARKKAEPILGRSMGEIKSNIHFYHTYNRVGNFMMKFYLIRNGKRIMLRSGEIRVRNFNECSPALWIHNVGHKHVDVVEPKYYPRANITAWAVLHWTCQNPKEFTIVRNVVFEWELRRLPSRRMVALVDKLIPMTADNLIQFRPWSLPYGKYELINRASVTFAKNEIIDETINLEDVGEFSIIMSNLTAVILGADHEIRARSEEIILNGSTSYDPDIPGDGRPQTLFQYRWKCSSSSKTSPCPRIDTNDNTLTIRPGILGLNINYTYTLQINDSMAPPMFRSDQTEKTLQIMPSNDQKYSMTCVQNCNKKAVANRKMILKCKCETLKNSQNARWEITGLGPMNGKNWNHTIVYDKENDRTSVYIQIEPIRLLALQMKRAMNDPDQTLNVGCRVQGDSGYVEKKIRVYLPPKPREAGRNSCTITPNQGIALSTPFTIQCDIFEEDPGDEPNPPLEYAFYYKLSSTEHLSEYPYDNHSKPGYYLFYHEVTANGSLTESQKQHIFRFVLPSGDATNSFELPIRVEITNDVGNLFSIDIFPGPTVMKTNFTEIEGIYRGPSGQVLERSIFFATLTASGDYAGALQFILPTIQQLIIINGTNVRDSQASRIKGEMLTTMTDIKPKTLSTFRVLEHTGNVLFAFAHYDFYTTDNVCDNVCLSHVATLIEDLADELQRYLRPAEVIQRRVVRLIKRGVLDDHVINVARAGVETTGHILSLVWKNQRSLLRGGNERGTSSLIQIQESDVGLSPDIDRDYFTIETLGSDRDFLVSLEADNSDTIQLQIQDMSKLAERLLLTLKLFGDALISKRSIVDPPLHIFYPDNEDINISLSVELFHASQLAGQKFPHGIDDKEDFLLASNFVLLSNDTKIDVEGDDKLVQVLVIIAEMNPFLEPEEPTELETALFLIEFKDDFTGLIKSPRVSQPHQFSYALLMRESMLQRVMAPFHASVPTHIAPLKINSVAPERLENKDIIVHQISVPRNSRIYIIINGSLGLDIKVIVQNTTRPTCQDYNKPTIPITDFTAGLVQNEQSKQFIYGVDTPGNEDFNSIVPLDYYFSFWPTEVSLKSANLKVNEDKTINIAGLFARYACISRDTIVTSVWTEDCIVTKVEDEGGVLTCRCQHLSIFGVSIARTNGSELPFTELEVFQVLDQNRIIPYVVAGCLLTYIICFIILAYWDRHNHVVRPKVVIMADIKRLREETFYLILVETGNNFLAGSTANVCCQLYGEKGRSREYVLSDKHLDTTRQNGYDTFLVSSKKYLGRLEKIRVWHDNYGHTASWYCRQIVVRDIKTDEFWIFFIRRWLTIYMDRESLICRQLVATSPEVERYLGNRLTFSRYWQRMREHHLWMCPLTCPPRSTYLRIERLTCATGVLFIYMLILILLYGMPNENSLASMSEFGDYDFEDFLVWYGFIAAVVGLFLGFILVLLFRRICKERIPAIIAWDRTKEVENIQEMKTKPRKVTKKLEEIYRNQEEIYETDSEDDMGRWDNLDPDRIMVVGVPADPETKKYVAPPPPVTSTRPRHVVPVSATPSSTHFFSIPSTDMLQTERWISEVMDRTHGAPKADDFVRTVEPDKNKIPGWERMVDLGLFAQVNKMRNEDPSSFVYQSSEPIDNLVRDSIRYNYEDDDDEDSEDSIVDNEQKNVRANVPTEPEEQNPEVLALIGGGEMVQTDLSNVHVSIPTVRHAKIQTDADIRSNSEPVPKLFEEEYLSDDDPDFPPPQRDRSETNLLRTEPTVVTIKPFLNPVKFSVELGEVDYDYGKRRMIPRKLLWVPWLVCILVILISAIVTIIYGLRYSYVRSLDWCTSLVIAVIISIVSLQPLSVLVIFLFTMHRARKYPGRSGEEHRIFNKFKLIWKHGQSLKIWPLNYMLYIPTFFQPPLSGVQIFMDKLKVRRKARIRRSLIDFIVYSIFIILVILAGDLSRDVSFYQNMRTVEDMLLLENETHILQSPDAFRNIRDDKEYMSNVFVHSVHLGVDTRGRALTVLRSNAAIRTRNREVVLLGVPRIRQLRVTPEAHNCTKNDTLRPHCNEDFEDWWYYSNKDTQNYSEGWRKDANPRIFSKRNDFWRFNGGEETLSTYTYGELNSYDGSGYIAELGRIQSTSLGVLNEMELTKWIDERTRAILVELSMYNPNLNIHSVIILLLEKASSLQYITSSKVLTWRFPISEELNDDLYVSPPALYFSIFIFSLCLLHFFIFTVVSSIKSFRQIGFRAFRQFLFWTDICIITIGVIAIWNHFINAKLLDNKFAELRAAAANSYVSFQIEEERQERQVLYFSILMTLGIIKLWYLLVVSNRIFFIIGFTFNITGPFVLGCILIFNILLLGFCIGARIVFGEIRNYRSVGTSILTQTYHAGLRNIMPYDTFVELAPVFGRLFYFCFTVFVVILFINVMASVITLGMQEAKETSLQRPFRFSYWNYIWLKLQLIIPDSIRIRFESRYNDPLLTQEREDQMERTLIPVLWNHIYSIPVRRVQEMKNIIELLVEDTDLILVSKKEKELAKKLKILKIEEGRVNRMRELTIRYIKEKLKVEFGAKELAEYNNFNFTVLQLKCKKLEKKVNQLDETIGKYDLQKLKYLQSNRSSQPKDFMDVVVGPSGGPWESESETEATSRLK